MAAVPSKTRFDLYLASYQKLSVFILLPALLNLISSVFFVSGGGDFFFLQFGFVRFISRAFGEDVSNRNIVLIAVAIGLLALEVILVFFAAKGKKWALPAFGALYFGDLIATIFLFFEENKANYVLSLVVHGAIFVALILGFVFYSLAEKELEKEEKGK